MYSISLLCNSGIHYIFTAAHDMPNSDVLLPGIELVTAIYNWKWVGGGGGGGGEALQVFSRFFYCLPDFVAVKELHHFGGFQYMSVWTLVSTKR